MAIPNDVAAEFSPQLRTRGRDYQQRGRIEIVQASDTSIDALVQGTDLYQVSIDVDEDWEGGLDFECSCPYALDNGVCKHIWAMLLHADAEGYLGASRAGTSASRSPSPAAIPSWKQQLRHLRQQAANTPAPRSPASWPADRQIIYVVDVPATLAGGRGLVAEMATMGRKKNGEWEPRVERFQNDPACKVFLISLNAGGLGLNLTAADYVFLLDPWWNPAVEAQAIDRAHRIGQTRRVFASRLIARATVEEKVLELQQSKRDLADAIINADNSLIAKIDRRDLEVLLG